MRADILRTKFRDRIQSKTSWGRNELMLVLEQSINDALNEQFSHLEPKDPTVPITFTMNDEPF